MDYKEKLNALLKNSESELEQEIIEDLLEEDDVESFLKDLLSYGCVSGNSKLIYYNQTKDFYIKHMEEIDEMLSDIEDSIGEPLKKTFPIYNWMAWFGYEETARKVAEKLGLEI